MNKEQQLNSLRILKTYGIDLQKSKALISEIREWGGKKYKKVQDGKWVELKDTKQGVKEREVAPSGMKKVVISELDRHRDEYEKVRTRESKKWMNENNISNLFKIQDKVRFSMFLETNDEVIKAREQFLLIKKDLQEDLDEIEELFQKQEKLKREEKAGKKEIDSNSLEYKVVIEEISKSSKLLNNIPDYCTPEEALGKVVTVDNYWLNTDTLFKSIYEYSGNIKNDKNEWVDDVEREWSKMKLNKDLEHTFSPKSSSEYLVNKKTGDIYRKADHWGRCASCYWGLDGKEDYCIAKSNVKDFERNNRNSFGNPEKFKAILKSSSNNLELIKKLLDSESQYLDKTTSISIKSKIRDIEHNLSRLYNINKEEVERLREEYRTIFEYSR